MKTHVKFPCGYEIYIETGVFDFGGISILELDACPIHGKKCSKWIK